MDKTWNTLYPNTLTWTGEADCAVCHGTGTPPSISALAELTGRPSRNLSRQLRTMANYGLVEMRHEQKKVRHLRFGELPTAAQHRLEQADGDTLLRWSEGVLTASSLDEVLGG